MVFLSVLSVLILPLTFGEEMQKLKVMFFGDSVVSGAQSSEASVCPFRYDFLKALKTQGKEITVIGTNKDSEGTCQKIGEELQLDHNGYQNAGIDELLDYIAADLQYLYNPVDYLFTSIGLQDCLKCEEGTDFQIISQSIRRIMGRLLNLNKNGKIYHIPILIPPSAGKTAVECMNFVNQKLRDVYDPSKNHGSIRVIDPLNGKAPTDDMFYILGGTTKTKKTPATKPATVTPPAPVAPAVKVPVKPTTPVVTPPAPVVKPTAPVVTPPTPVVKPTKPVVRPSTPVFKPTTPVVTPPAPVTAPEVSKVTQPEEGRRLSRPLEFLPKPELITKITEVLIKDLDWSFRAQTLAPTPEVTKEPEYYGYEWCKGVYGDDECFQYYYGYVWCLGKYGEEECYNYYYGEVEEWKKDDSYKWCLNFYDEEYCSFAYQGNEPDTWDWLSFGYHDCIKEKDNNVCFEQYYGYAWCVNEYSDNDCYEYYYGGDEWQWDTASNRKWCKNFYSEDVCATRYQDGGPSVSTSILQSATPGSTNKNIGVVAALVVAILACLCYKRMSCFKKTEYSRLDTKYMGGEDEVELL